MSEKMSLITVDGESKTCKTTAAEKIEEHFRGVTRTRVRGAGGVFRLVTKLSLKETDGKIGNVLEDPRRLESLIEKVERDYDLDDTSAWGNLHTKDIDKVVSDIGATPAAQRLIERWYTKSAQRAYEEGVGIFILEGRRPRPMVENPHLRSGKVVSELDLLLRCGTRVAAERALGGEPSDDAILNKEQEIIRRRHQDRTRADNPFVEPELHMHIPGKDLPAVTVERAAAHGYARRDIGDDNGFWLPMTVCLDVTHQDLIEMTASVQGLAEAAHARAA